MDGNIPANAYFRIIDLSGKVLLQKRISSSSMQLDNAKLTNGIYLYQVGTDKPLIKTRKWVIRYETD